MRSGGWDPHDGISALKRRGRGTTELVLSLSSPTCTKERRPCEDIARRWPMAAQREVSPGPGPAGTLILDYQISRKNCEK